MCVCIVVVAFGPARYIFSCLLSSTLFSLDLAPPPQVGALASAPHWAAQKRMPHQEFTKELEGRGGHQKDRRLLAAPTWAS